MLSSLQTRNKTAILNWLTQNRFNRLSEDNKIRVWSKVYDKEEPSKIEVRGILVSLNDDLANKLIDLLHSIPQTSHNAAIPLISSTPNSLPGNDLH